MQNRRACWTADHKLLECASFRAPREPPDASILLTDAPHARHFAAPPSDALNAKARSHASPKQRKLPFVKKYCRSPLPCPNEHDSGPLSSQHKAFVAAAKSAENRHVDA